MNAVRQIVRKIVRRLRTRQRQFEARIRELVRHLETPYPILRLKTAMGSRYCELRKRMSWTDETRRGWEHRQLWFDGIINELSYWDKWLASPEGESWKIAVQDPARPIQDHVVYDQIGRIGEDRIRILDVGAGPAPTLGYIYPGKTLQIAAVDPLAREYVKVLGRSAVALPVSPTKGSGERLMASYRPKTFDIVYACNALDHSYDPLLVIRNMVALAKYDRFVIIRHYVNEGHLGSYGGLHQWNFDIRDGELILWNQRVNLNVTQILKDQAEVRCWYESSSAYGGFDWRDWVVVVMRIRHTGTDGPRPPTFGAKTAVVASGASRP